MRLCRAVGGKHLDCNVAACAVVLCLLLAWDWDCLCFSFDRNYIPLEKQWEQLLHTQAVPGCLLQLQINKLQLAQALKSMFPLELAFCLCPLVEGVLRYEIEDDTLEDFPGTKDTDTSGQDLWYILVSAILAPSNCSTWPRSCSLAQLVSASLTDWALLAPGSDQEECSSYKLVGF